MTVIDNTTPKSIVPVDKIPSGKLFRTNNNKDAAANAVLYYKTDLSGLPDPVRKLLDPNVQRYAHRVQDGKLVLFESDMTGYEIDATLTLTGFPKAV